MINKTTIFTLLLAVLIAGCSHFVKPQQPAIPAKVSLANDGKDIYLQDLKTRMIVVCHESLYETAETCAQYFEQANYVRLKNIPVKVAKYDRLTKDTFPTRRWRDGERTPRW